MCDIACIMYFYLKDLQCKKNKFSERSRGTKGYRVKNLNKIHGNQNGC